MSENEHANAMTEKSKHFYEQTIKGCSAQEHGGPIDCDFCYLFLTYSDYLS